METGSHDIAKFFPCYAPSYLMSSLSPPRVEQRFPESLIGLLETSLLGAFLWLGTCGQDSLEFLTHPEMRSAQAQVSSRQLGSEPVMVGKGGILFRFPTPTCLRDPYCQPALLQASISRLVERVYLTNQILSERPKRRYL